MIHESVGGELRGMLREGRINPNDLLDIMGVVKNHFEVWQSQVIDSLKEMIDKWEESMGDDDDSLYSLGLRRAIDVITNETAESKLPILERPDTPDE